jgi:DNA (cytosine-5)-methyltransferase 1
VVTSCTAAKNERSTAPPADDVACADLFCGAGGLTHGLISAGVPVIAGVDIDEACEHPYESNNPGASFHTRDVAKLEASEVESWFGTASIRVLAGCAPCQPFSTYTQRYETRGTQRWGLLNHFARLVKQLQPDIVTMENVPTVTKHDIFDDFVAALRRRGYEVWYGVADSADYGLPQRRRRTVLLASLGGPIRLREPDSSSPKTVRDVLAELPAIGHGESHDEDPLHVSSRLSALNFERIKASRPGGSWRDWPKRLIAECHLRDTGRSYPGVYGRMAWDQPAPTLTTQFYGFGSGRFGHPDQDRALSLREGAILQGFPKTYSFVPDGERIQFKVLGRLIGNAVPVELGRAVGESILDHIGRSPLPPSAQRRGQNGSTDQPASTIVA